MISKKKRMIITAVLVTVPVMMSAVVVMAAPNAGQVSTAIENTWKQAASQIKTVTNNVIFPVVDCILAILLFVKVAMSYFEYKKHGEFDFMPPAILFFGDFFSMINLMGAELFELEWIKAILLFFYYFAWALYVVGIVVAVFDMAIEAQRGKGSFQDVGLNVLKGFFAVSLFTVVPVDLYVFCINLSDRLIEAVAGMADSPGKLGMLSKMILGSFEITNTNVVVAIVFVILIGYAVIKVFFANLKRGGILLIMMATGSLYMFSVPRGYNDGFVSWCKQVAALCLTAFLQTIVLVAGLVTYNTNMLLGIGLMLSSTEVPRIAQNFGLDTSTKFNVMSTVYSANSVINMARNAGKMIAR